MLGFKFFFIFWISFIVRKASCAGSAPPRYVMTKSSYDKTISMLNEHVRYIKSLPDLRNGSTPLFFIHKPGSRVHGTVFLFHGYSSLAAGSIVQARHLFSQKFNVFSLNLAGFAQSPKHWVSATLRESAGYSAIRTTLLNDPLIYSRIRSLNDARTVEEQTRVTDNFKGQAMTAVIRSLWKGLTYKDFKMARLSITLMTDDSRMGATEQQFRKHFISGHQRFESDPFAKLRFSEALPGPVHAVSFSFGATALLNLAAQSGIISKAVMLAPFLGWHTVPARADVTRFYMLLGALDLVSQEIPSANGLLAVPGRAITPAVMAAGLANRRSVMRAVRRSTKMLCVVAEDDSAIDVKHALRVCRNKLGGRALLYPESLRLGHLITPETGSRFGSALMEQIANYFISGNVDEKQFLTPNM